MVEVFLKSMKIALFTSVMSEHCSMDFMRIFL